MNWHLGVCGFGIWLGIILLHHVSSLKVLISPQTNSYQITCNPLAEFSCPNASKCLSFESVCDGYKQCPDGSDETNCDPSNDVQKPLERWRRSESNTATRSVIISGEIFHCETDNSTIVREFLCDGETDCLDGTDEWDCPPVSQCDTNELLCADGQRCIPNSWKCDGSKDCQDGSDEAICDDMKCHETQFLCSSSHECIPMSFVCDGSRDCLNGEDEEDCSAKGTKREGLKPCDSLIDGFSCDSSNNMCIPFSKACDGVSDCENGKDEENCGNPCESNPCNEDQSCSPAPGGSYHCSCSDGFLKAGKECLDVNECQVSGEVNLCGQRCENTHGSYVCQCETGYRLSSDGISCEAMSADAVLFFAEGTSIRALKLKDHSMTLVQSHLTIPIAVAYDSKNKEVFWSDVHQSAIKSVEIHGFRREPRLVLTEGLAEPEGLSMDWLARNLYIAEANNRAIIACSIDKAHMCTVVVKLAGNIRAITIHPLKGQMFWTDWSDERPGIERAGLDGSQRKMIVSDNIRWPNGIALDPVQEMLYWTDGQLKHIERADINGKNRKVILTSLDHPFSIAVFENKMYWSDWGSHSIEVADKITGKNRKSIVKDRSLPAGLYLHHRLLQQKSHIVNPCEKARCEHICLLAPGPKHSCLCKNGYKLNDDLQSCSINVSCSHGKAMCPGSALCIPTAWFCDKQPDCPNGADEENCPTATTRPVIPEVITSQVLSTTKKVEGKVTKPCPVDSDFRCPANDVCIPASRLCDHVVDCPGGEDEMDCKSKDSGTTPKRKTTKGTPSRRLPKPTTTTEKPTTAKPVCKADSCPEDMVCRSGHNSQDFSCECPQGTNKNGTECLDIDECINQYDLCSQTCENYFGTYQCECLPGYRMASDHVTCRVRSGSPKLFYAAHTSIQVMVIKSRRIENVQIQTGLAVSVAYDYVENLVFWSEVHDSDSEEANGRVRAVYFKDETEKPITILDKEVSQPEGLVVDWVNHLLYITDVGKQRIIACTFSGHKCSTVLKATGSLRSIVVHPAEGLMFWTDWSDNSAGIERAGMDGSAPMTIVKENIAWPNGVAIDYTQDLIFWADSKLDRIERCRLDGSDRKVLVVGVDHPFSIAVFENTLYWSDWARYAIESANKVSGQQRSVLLDGGSNPSGIYLFHALTQQPYENPCTQNTCDYLCLIGPGKSHTCAYPLGETGPQHSIRRWILPIVVILLILAIALATLYYLFKRRFLFKSAASNYTLKKPIVLFRKRLLSEKQHIVENEHDTCGRGVLPTMESFENPVFSHTLGNNEKPLLGIKPLETGDSPKLHKSDSKKSIPSLPDNDSAIFSVTSRSPSTTSRADPYEISV